MYPKLARLPHGFSVTHVVSYVPLVVTHKSLSLSLKKSYNISLSLPSNSYLHPPTNTTPMTN